MADVTRPTWQLKGAISDAMDQRDRRRRAAAVRFGASSGGANPGSAPGDATSSGENIILSIADGGSETVDIGAVADYACAWVRYWLRRNYAAPVTAIGSLELLHNGTDVDLDRQETVRSGAAEHGVDFAVAIADGVLQLTVSATDETPDATADVTLIIDALETT